MEIYDQNKKDDKITRNKNYNILQLKHKQQHYYSVIQINPTFKIRNFHSNAQIIGQPYSNARNQMPQKLKMIFCIFFFPAPSKN